MALTTESSRERRPPDAWVEEVAGGVGVLAALQDYARA